MTKTALEIVDMKIAAIESSDWHLAFDECHKIYFITGDVNEAVDIGYSLYPSSDLRELIDRSCGLVFVSNFEFKDEWKSLEIRQGELYDAGYWPDEE